MSQFLDAYSIQYWLESCPQAYLEGTEYGHGPGEKEPDGLLSDPFLREQAIALTVQLIAGERCALAASSGLINSAPDYAAKTFLATQTLDEARHVEIFTRRLMDLGVKKNEIDEVVAELANPNLVRFAEILLEKVDKGDFVSGVVGQNIVLEGMAFSVFEMLQAGSKALNPKFAHTLSGTIADERRHVGFGENYIGKLIQQHPEKKPEVEQMQKAMSYYMLATFADRMRSGDAQEERRRARELAAASGAATPDAAQWQGVDLANAAPEELEGVLSDTILKDFRARLTRIGLEYQTPDRP
ncbi:MAG TPA: hypothetical protein ENO23_04495 [Alphaproteobacteria bacterium]|nr:hypothetical protein [Alphaproteobacteria bacterium]